MMMELVGGAGNWILTPRSKEQTQTGFLLLSLLTKCSLKESGKRVTEDNEGFCQNPAIFSILHSLQNPISAPPHGSEQNFNNISRTKLVERTSQWRGTNAQVFFLPFLDIIVTMWHTFRMFYDTEMLSAMLWLCVTESVTQVWRVTGERCSRDTMNGLWLVRGDTCDITNPLDCAG